MPREHNHEIELYRSAEEALDSIKERLKAAEHCATLLKRLYDRNMQISRFMGQQEEADVNEALNAYMWSIKK